MQKDVVFVRKRKQTLCKTSVLKIIKKYSCVIYPNAVVGRGFEIAHPTGIVIGKCKIGALSFVSKSINEPGIYVGTPAKKVNK